MSAAYTPLFPLPQLSARDAHNKAEHYDSQYNKDSKYLQYNYWGKIYKNLHPVHTQPGTEQRTRCLNVLKKALEWHLDNTINGDERTKIMAAQREINAYK
jgi:hypothetical protein